MLSAFGAVTKDDGECLDPWVFAVTFDQLIQNRLRVVPLTGIKKTQGHCKTWPDPDWVRPNQGEGEFQGLFVPTLATQEGNH